MDELDWIKEIVPTYIRVDDLQPGKSYKYLYDRQAYIDDIISAESVVTDDIKPVFIDKWVGEILHVTHIEVSREFSSTESIIIRFSASNKDYRLSTGVNLFRWAKFQEV